MCFFYIASTVISSSSLTFSFTLSNKCLITSIVSISIHCTFYPEFWFGSVLYISFFHALIQLNMFEYRYNNGFNVFVNFPPVQVWGQLQLFDLLPYALYIPDLFYTIFNLMAYIMCFNFLGARFFSYYHKYSQDTFWDRVKKRFQSFGFAFQGSLGRTKAVQNQDLIISHYWVKIILRILPISCEIIVSLWIKKCIPY